YFYVFWIELGGLIPNLGGAPPATVVAGALTCVAAGVVSHRRIRARGPDARTGVVVLGIAVALAVTALSAFFRAPLTVEGEPTLGFGAGLLILCFITGFYSWSLGRRQWVLFAAMVAVVALGLLVFPDRSAITARGVIAAIAYNLFPYFPLRHLARALRQAGDRHTADIDAIDEGRERAAFMDGWESVVGLVRQARQEAVRQLDALRPTIDARLADMASRRQEEVERRLETIEPAAGSSS
ncbi:MAG TPA: hypothetical protein VHT97_01415, partial [Acidimicrobiales bacterium]|nr:hypothetical protein [Acidimicrobiales bacterium]